MHHSQQPRDYYVELTASNQRNMDLQQEVRNNRFSIRALVVALVASVALNIAQAFPLL